MGFGFSSYLGDLKKSRGLDTKPSINLGVRYTILERVSLRGTIAWYQLAATDSENGDQAFKNRNLSFKSNNFEFGGHGVVSLIPEVGSKYTPKRNSSPFNPYFFLGVGITTYKPTAELNGERFNLRKLQTEGVKYGSVAFTIPAGLGIRYKINDDWAVGLEGGYRLIFTDYLDDVSTIYQDPNFFEDPNAAALADRGPELGLPAKMAGDQRGNPSNDDNYFIISINIEYLNALNLFGGGKNPYNSFRPKRRKR